MSKITFGKKQAPPTDAQLAMNEALDTFHKVKVRRTKEQYEAAEAKAKQLMSDLGGYTAANRTLSWIEGLFILDWDISDREAAADHPVCWREFAVDCMPLSHVGEDHSVTVYSPTNEAIALHIDDRIGIHMMLCHSLRQYKSLKPLDPEPCPPKKKRKKRASSKPSKAT